MNIHGFKLRVERARDTKRKLYARLNSHNAKNKFEELAIKNSIDNIDKGIKVLNVKIKKLRQVRDAKKKR